MRKRLFGIFGTVFLLIGSAFAQSETLFSNLLQPVDTADKPSFVFAGQSYATMFQTGGITTSIDGASFFISNEADGTHGLSAMIYSDNAGTPGNYVAGLSSFTVNSWSAQVYTVSATGVYLAPNTTYWMVLQTGDADPTATIYWQTTMSDVADSGSAFSPGAGAGMWTKQYGRDNPWTQITGASTYGQFSLTGSPVPESGAWGLAMGAAATGLVVRKRCRAARLL